MTLYKGPNSLFRALAPNYRLNKAEFLQIYNLKPTTQVELQLIIEEVCPSCLVILRVTGENRHRPKINACQSHTRFTEEQLDEMVEIIQQVFEEEEAAIPEGVEAQEMEKISNKLLGASKKRRKGVKRKA
jgi:hypothetical protein